MSLSENHKLQALFVRSFLQSNIPEHKQPESVRVLLKQLLEIKEGETDDLAPLDRFCKDEGGQRTLDDEKMFNFIDGLRDILNAN